MVEGIAELLDIALVYVKTWAPPLLAYLLLRTVGTRITRNYMWRKASHSLPDPVEAPRSSTPNPARLQTRRFDARQEVRIDDPSLQAMLERSLTTGRRSSWNYIMAMTLYAVTAGPQLFLALQHGGEGGQEFTQTLVASSLPVVILVVWMASLMVVSMRAASLGCVPFLSALFSLVVLTLLALLMTVVYSVSWPLALAPGVLAIGVFLLLRHRSLAATDTSGNRRLLVLRLFEADRNTVFTFGKLASLWRFLGSVMTVADPSWLRWRYSLAFPKAKLQFLRSIFLLTLAVTALSLGIEAISFILPGNLRGALDMPHAKRVELLSTLAWILVLPLALLPLWQAVRKRFIDSPEKLRQRLHHIDRDTASLNHTFREVSMYCHSDSWKQTVLSLLERSSAVIMDLRGLDASRAGSLYEIGLVVDHFPLHKVVMLANDEDEAERLAAHVSKRLVDTPEGSPNRMEGDLCLMVYLPGCYDPRDSERLMALQVAATAESKVTVISESPPASAWNLFKTTWDRFGQWRQRLAETSDMLVARPDVSRLVLPVLLAVVVTLFTLRLGPLLDSWHLFMNPREMKVTVVDDDTTDAGMEDSMDALADALERYENPASQLALADTEVQVEPDTPLLSESTPVRVEQHSSKYDIWSKDQLIELVVTDRLAGEAVEYGLVQIQEVRMTSGEQLTVKRVEGPGFVNPNLLEETEEVSRSYTDDSSDDGILKHYRSHPDTSLRLTLQVEHPSKSGSIEVIRGSVLVRYPDPGLLKRIAIPELPPVGVTALVHPELDALGSFKLIVFEESDGVQIDYITESGDPVEFYLYDGSNTRSSQYSYGSASMGGPVYRHITFDAEQIKGGGIELVTPGPLLEGRLHFEAFDIPVN